MPRKIHIDCGEIEPEAFPERRIALPCRVGQVRPSVPVELPEDSSPPIPPNVPARYHQDGLGLRIDQRRRQAENQLTADSTRRPAEAEGPDRFAARSDSGCDR